ncbi:MAG TPA: SGNH/GDSL hydrolase family protein, partial [Planctomycetota bacterium]|nr:SGNH/GDSL hydrolase family protein [Planctomycetota bacterium]
MTRTVLVVVLAGLCAAAAAQDFVLPAPAKTPPWNPFVPEGEKSLYPVYMHGCPGARMWVQWLHTADVWHYGTTQSVGDGAGMYVWLPAKGKPGFLCSMDTGVQASQKDGKVVFDDYADYAGISLWIKGDGSEGTAVISTNWSVSNHRYRIPLSDTNWHKVFMAWEDFKPEPIKGHFWYLTLGLEPADDTKPSWYIVDRVHLYKRKVTEKITPTPDVDPPGMLPARAFVSGREHIAKTLAKLKARQPVKIVVAGDSLVTGAQLGYTRHDYTETDTQRKYFFFAVLGERLREHYGYGSLAVVYREYQGDKGPWRDWPDPRPEADLTVMSVARGGWEAVKGLGHLDQVLAEKPDCVVWEYGGNEMINGHLKSYVESTEAAVDRLKAAGIEVVLQTVTPTSDLQPKPWLGEKTFAEYGGEISAETRRIAREKG